MSVVSSQPEEWRPITGYEDRYQVNDHGHVRSVAGGILREMTWVYDSDGYPTVKLRKDGKSTRFKIHRLVCAEFNGPPKIKGLQCVHLDGNRANPRASNLAWATNAENMSHKRLHGTHQSGERGTGAKLSQVEVDQILQRAASGETSTALAAEFGLTRGHIRRIIVGGAWKDSRARDPAGVMP